MTRQLLVAVLVTVGSSCHAESQSQSEPQSKKAIMTQDMTNEAKRIVGTVARAPELTKAAIDKLLGVSLALEPNAPPASLDYVAKFAEGPFDQLEVREPSPEQDRSWLAVLTVREGVKLPLSAFENDPIPVGPPQDIQPRVPPEGTISYIVQSPNQRIHYSFRAQSRILQLVAFHRAP